jgi:hypothetical protein
MLNRCYASLTYLFGGSSAYSERRVHCIELSSPCVGAAAPTDLRQDDPPIRALAHINYYRE